MGDDEVAIGAGKDAAIHVVHVAFYVYYFFANAKYLGLCSEAVAGFDGVKEVDIEGEGGVVGIGIHRDDAPADGLVDNKAHHAAVDVAVGVGHFFAHLHREDCMAFLNGFEGEREPVASGGAGVGNDFAQIVFFDEGEHVSVRYFAVSHYAKFSQYAPNSKLVENSLFWAYGNRNNQGAKKAIPGMVYV